MISRIIKKPTFWLIAIVAFGCGTSEAQRITVVSNEQLVELLKNEEVQLVDVRTPEEISYGKIQNAKHIDYYDPQFVTKAGDLDKEKPVIVYCAAGSRSAQSAARLKELDFKKIYDLKGGFRAWKAEGYPVIKE